jgi:hypothetical protein
VRRPRGADPPGVVVGAYVGEAAGLAADVLRGETNGAGKSAAAADDEQGLVPQRSVHGSVNPGLGPPRSTDSMMFTVSNLTDVPSSGHADLADDRLVTGSLSCTAAGSR